MENKFNMEQDLLGGIDPITNLPTDFKILGQEEFDKMDVSLDGLGTDFLSQGTGDISKFDYQDRFTTDPMKLQYQRYSNQSSLNALSRAKVRFGVSLVGNVVKGVTDIPDVLYNLAQLGFGTPENMTEGNPISKALQSMMDATAEYMPIYTNPYKEGWDPGSANWWLSHTDSLASAASYIIPSKWVSGAVVKGLGYITKAAKTAKGMKVAEGVGSIAASVYSTSHEALGTILDTYPDLMAAALESGMSEEEARKWAAGQASKMYKTNMINVLPEAIGVYKMIKTPARTRNLIGNFAQRQLSDLTSEMIPEAFQEAVNLYSQKNALREADILRGKEEFGYSILDDFIHDKEAWTSMTMGAVGGKVFQSGGRVMESYKQTEGSVFTKAGAGLKTAFTGLTAEDAKLRQKQLEVQESYNETMLSVSAVKDMADLVGDTELSSKLDNILTVNEAYKNFELGSTQAFENTLNSIRQHAIETGNTDLQERVEGALKRTLDAEAIFNDTFEVYPGMDSPTRKEYVTNQTEINRLTEQNRDFEQRYNDIVNRDEHGVYEIPDRDRQTLEEYFDIQKQLDEAYSILEDGDPNLDGESGKREEARQKVEELEKAKAEKEKSLSSSPSAAMAMEMSRNNFEINKLQEAQKELVRGTRKKESELSPFETEIKNEYETRLSRGKLGKLIDQAANEQFIEESQKEDYDPLSYSESIDFNLNEENLSILDNDLMDLDEKTDSEIQQNEEASLEAKKKFLEDFAKRHDEDLSDLLEDEETTVEDINEEIEGAKQFIEDIKENEDYESDLTEEQKAEKAVLEAAMQDSLGALGQFEKTKEDLKAKKQKIVEAREKIYKVKERKIPNSTAEIVQEKVEEFFEIVQDGDILNLSQLNDYINTLTTFKDYINKHFTAAEKSKIQPFIDKIEKQIKKASSVLKDLEKKEELAQKQSRKDFLDAFDAKSEKEVKPTPVPEEETRKLVDKIKTKFKNILSTDGKRMFSDVVLDQQANNNDNLFTDVASYVFSVLSLSPNVPNEALKAFKVSMNLRDLQSLSSAVQNPGELKELIDMLRELRKHQLRNRVGGSVAGDQTMRKIYEGEKDLGIDNKPFYQQLNAIRELVAMFFNGNTKFAYLQGVAGSGKSNLVTKYAVALIKKLAGVSINVGAYAPGANANAVISQSINGSPIKKDYFASEAAMDEMIKEIVDKKLALVIIDEAGKLTEDQVSYLYEKLEAEASNTRVIFTGDPNQKTEGVGFPLLNATSSPFYGNLHVTEGLTISQRSGNYDIIQAQNTFLSAGGGKVDAISVTSNTESTQGVEGLSYTDFLRKVSKRMGLEDGKSRMIIVDDNMSQQGIDKLRDELNLDPSIEIQTVKSSQGQEADEVFIFIPYKDRKNPLQDTLLNGGFHNTANTDMYVALSRAKSYVAMHLGEDIDVSSNKLDVSKSDEGDKLLQEKFANRSIQYDLELKAALEEEGAEAALDKFEEERRKRKEEAETDEDLNEKYGQEVEVDENGNVVNEDGEIIDTITPEEDVKEEPLTEEEVASIADEPLIEDIEFEPVEETDTTTDENVTKDTTAEQELEKKKADIQRKRQEKLDKADASKKKAIERIEEITETPLSLSGSKVTEDNAVKLLNEVYRMREKGGLSEKESRALYRIEANAAVLGFTIVDPLGKEYDDRWNIVVVTFKAGTSKDPNARKVFTKVWKPEVHKNGKIEQRAEVDVLQNATEEEIRKALQFAKEDSIERRKSEINAKYDAELAALEQQFATNTELETTGQQPTYVRIVLEKRQKELDKADRPKIKSKERIAEIQKTNASDFAKPYSTKKNSKKYVYPDNSEVSYYERYDSNGTVIYTKESGDKSEEITKEEFEKVLQEIGEINKQIALLNEVTRMRKNGGLTTEESNELDNIENKAKELGLEIVDLLGKEFDDRSTINVVSVNEGSGKGDRQVIVKVLKPSILYKGKLEQRAEVVVLQSATDEEFEKALNSAREDSIQKKKDKIIAKYDEQLAALEQQSTTPSNESKWLSTVVEKAKKAYTEYVRKVLGKEPSALYLFDNILNNPTADGFNNILQQFYNGIRTANYDNSNVEQGLDEYTSKTNEEIEKVEDQNGWHYRIPSEEARGKSKYRISLNVKGDKKLIDVLDKIAKDYGIYYKTPSSTVNWLDRHDPVTIYITNLNLTEDQLQELKDRVVNETKPFIRSNEGFGLYGENISKGVEFGEEATKEVANQYIKEASAIDPILGEGVKQFLTNKQGKVQGSVGQQMAVRELLDTINGAIKPESTKTDINEKEIASIKEEIKSVENEISNLDKQKENEKRSIKEESQKRISDLEKEKEDKINSIKKEEKKSLPKELDPEVDLTKEGYTPQYFSISNSKGVWGSKPENAPKVGATAFKLFVSPDGQTAYFEFYNQPSTIKSIALYKERIDNVSNEKNYNPEATNIKTIKRGKAKLRDGKWEMVEKMEHYYETSNKKYNPETSNDQENSKERAKIEKEYGEKIKKEKDSAEQKVKDKEKQVNEKINNLTDKKSQLEGKIDTLNQQPVSQKQDQKPKKVVKVYHHTQKSAQEFNFGSFQRGDQQVSQWGDGLNASTETNQFYIDNYGNPIEGEVNDSDFVEIDANMSEAEIYKYLIGLGYKINTPQFKSGKYLSNSAEEEYSDTTPVKDNPAVFNLFNDFQQSNPEVKGVKIKNHVIRGQKVKPFYVIYDAKSFYGGNSLSSQQTNQNKTKEEKVKEAEGQSQSVEERIKSIEQDIKSVDNQISNLKERKERVREEVNNEIKEKIDSLEKEKENLIQEKKNSDLSRDTSLPMELDPEVDLEKKGYTVKYYPNPIESNRAWEQKFGTPSPKAWASIYKFFISPSGDTAYFEFYNFGSTFEGVIDNPNRINPVGTPRNSYNPKATSIQTVKRGKAILVGDQWRAKENMEHFFESDGIEFNRDKLEPILSSQTVDEINEIEREYKKKRIKAKGSFKEKVANRAKQIDTLISDLNKEKESLIEKREILIQEKNNLDQEVEKIKTEPEQVQEETIVKEQSIIEEEAIIPEVNPAVDELQSLQSGKQDKKEASKNKTILDKVNESPEMFTVEERMVAKLSSQGDMQYNAQSILEIKSMVEQFKQDDLEATLPEYDEETQKIRDLYNQESEFQKQIDFDTIQEDILRNIEVATKKLKRRKDKKRRTIKKFDQDTKRQIEEAQNEEEKLDIRKRRESERLEMSKEFDDEISQLQRERESAMKELDDHNKSKIAKRMKEEVETSLGQQAISVVKEAVKEGLKDEEDENKNYIINHIDNLEDIDQETKDKVKEEVRKVRKAEKKALTLLEEKKKELEEKIKQVKEKREKESIKNVPSVVKREKTVKPASSEDSRGVKLYKETISKIKERLISEIDENIENLEDTLNRKKELIQHYEELLKDKTISAYDRTFILNQINELKLTSFKLERAIKISNFLDEYMANNYITIAQLKKEALKLGYKLPIKAADLEYDKIIEKEIELEILAKKNERKNRIKENKDILNHLNIFPDTLMDMDQVSDVLDKLPIDARTKKLYKKIFTLAKQLGTKVVFSSEGAGVAQNDDLKVAGYYSSAKHQVVIHIEHLNMINSGNVIVHELLHAVTSQTIYSVTSKDENTGEEFLNPDSELYDYMTSGQKEAVKSLIKTLKLVKNNNRTKEEYGATNIHELVAELANPEFASKLKKVYSKSDDNLFRKIINGILGLLGLKKSAYKTVYQALEDIITDNTIERSVLFTNYYEPDEIDDNLKTTYLTSLEVELERTNSKIAEAKNKYNQRYKEVLETAGISVPQILTNRVNKYEKQVADAQQRLLTANQKQKAQEGIKSTISLISTKLGKDNLEVETAEEADGRTMTVRDFDGKYEGSVKFGKTAEGYQEITVDVPEDSEIGRHMINLALGDAISREMKGIYVVNNDGKTDKIFKDNSHMFTNKSVGKGYTITNEAVGSDSENGITLINDFSSRNKHKHQSLRINNKKQPFEIQKVGKSKKAKPAAPIAMKEDVKDSEAIVKNDPKASKSLPPVVIENKVKNEIGEEFDEEFDEIFDFEEGAYDNYPTEEDSKDETKTDKGDFEKVPGSKYVFPRHSQIDFVQKDMELISFVVKDQNQFGGTFYRRVYVIKNPDTTQNTYVQVGVDEGVEENPLGNDTVVRQSLLQEFSQVQVDNAQGREIYKVTGKSKLSFKFDNNSYESFGDKLSMIKSKIKQLFEVNNQEVKSLEMEPIILTTKNVAEVTKQLKDSNMFSTKDSFKLGRTYIRFSITDVSGNQKYFFIPTRAKKKSKDSEDYKMLSTFIQAAENFNKDLKDNQVDIAEFGSNEEIQMTSTSKKGNVITMTKHRAAILILQGKQSYFEELQGVKTPSSATALSDLLFTLEDKPSIENASIAEGSVQYDKHIVTEGATSRRIIQKSSTNKDYPGWAVVEKTMGGRKSEFYRAVFTINHEVKGEMVSDHYVVDIPTENNKIVKQGSVRVYKNLKLENDAAIDRKSLNNFPVDYKAHVPKLDKGMSPEEVANHYLEKTTSGKKYNNGPVQKIVNQIARSNKNDFRKEGNRYDEKQKKVVYKTYYQSLFRGNPDFNILEGLKNLKENFDSLYDNIKITDVYGKGADHEKVLNQLETSISDITPTSLQVEKIEGATESEGIENPPGISPNPEEDIATADDILNMFGELDELLEVDENAVEKINEEDDGTISEEDLGLNEVLEEDVLTEEEVNNLEEQGEVIKEDELDKLSPELKKMINYVEKAFDEIVDLESKVIETLGLTEFDRKEAAVKYAKYLLEVFPDSVEKDIWFHGTNAEDFGNWDLLRPSKTGTIGKGIYLQRKTGDYGTGFFGKNTIAVVVNSRNTSDYENGNTGRRKLLELAKNYDESKDRYAGMGKTSPNSPLSQLRLFLRGQRYDAVLYKATETNDYLVILDTYRLNDSTEQEEYTEGKEITHMILGSQRDLNSLEEYNKNNDITFIKKEEPENNSYNEDEDLLKSNAQVIQNIEELNDDDFYTFSTEEELDPSELEGKGNYGIKTENGKPKYFLEQPLSLFEIFKNGKLIPTFDFSFYFDQEINGEVTTSTVEYQYDPETGEYYIQVSTENELGETDTVDIESLKELYDNYLSKEYITEDGNSNSFESLILEKGSNNLTGREIDEFYGEEYDEDFEYGNLENQNVDFDLTIDGALEYLQRQFPFLNRDQIQTVPLAVLQRQRGKDVYGYYKNGVYYLGTQDGKVSTEVMRHETFHLFFNRYLTPDQRKAMLAIVGKSSKYKSWLNENSLDDTATNREEYIAYDFQKKNWNYNKFSSPVMQFMHNMYLKLKNLLKSAFDFFMLDEADRIIEKLQRDILSGEFDKIQNKVSNERLMKDLSKSFKSKSLNTALVAFKEVSTYMKDYFFDKLEDGSKDIEDRFVLDFSYTTKTKKYATTDGKINFETVYGKMISRVRSKFNKHPKKADIDKVLKDKNGDLTEALKIFNDYNATIGDPANEIPLGEFYIYVLSRNSNFIDNLANFLFQQGDAKKAYQLATQFKQLTKDEEVDIEDISINLESEIMENNQHNNEKSVGKKLKKHLSLIRRSDENLKKNSNVDRYISFRKAYVKVLSFLSDVENMSDFGFMQNHLRTLKEKVTSLDDKHIVDKLQEIWELANMSFSRTNKPVSLDLTYNSVKIVDGKKVVEARPLVDSYNNKIIIAGRVFKFDSKTTNYNVFMTRIMREVEKAINQIVDYQKLSPADKKTYFKSANNPDGNEKSPLIPFVTQMIANKVFGTDFSKRADLKTILAQESMKYINDVYVRGFHRDMVASINYDMRQTKTNPHLVSKEDYTEIVEGEGPYNEEQKVEETYRMTALTTDSIQTAIVGKFRTYALDKVINEDKKKQFKEEIEKQLSQKKNGVYTRQVSSDFVRKVFRLRSNVPVSDIMRIRLYQMLEKQQHNLIGDKATVDTVTNAFADSSSYMRDISEELSSHEEFLSAQNYIDGRNNKRYIWVIRSAIYDVINALKSGKKAFAFSSRNPKLFNKSNIFLTGLQKVSDYIEFDTLKRKDSLYPGKVIKNLSGQQYYGVKFIAGFLGTALTNQNLYYQFGVRESNRNIEGGVKIKVLNAKELNTAIEAGADMEAKIIAIKDHLKSDKFKNDVALYKAGENVDNSFYQEKFGMSFKEFFNGYNVKNMNKKKDPKFKKGEQLQDFIGRTADLRNGAFVQFMNEWTDVEKSEVRYIFPTVRRFYARNSELVDMFLPQQYRGQDAIKIPGEVLLKASFDAFWVQNYINGYHYDNMVFGNHHFTKNSEDHIKREQGIRSPGKPVLTGDGYAPTKVNMAVYEDTERMKDATNDLKGIYSKIHGVSYEITDAASFMLPSALHDLQRGTGDYSLGEVVKNVVFYTDPITGKPVYIKTASFVLTPELRAKFPELDRIATEMEKNNVKHYVPKSAFKLGAPLEGVKPGESIGPHHISDLYMTGYKIQSNPVSLKEKSKVSNFSQLNYFLNVNMKNFGEAMRVYTADSNIANFAFKLFNLKKNIFNEDTQEYNTGNVVKTILETLRESETGYRMAEIVEKGNISHNFPYVVKNFITQIANIVSKKTLEVKHVGNKLTVQPALGVEFYEGAEGLTTYNELSDADKAKAKNFLSLPYEVKEFIKTYDKQTFNDPKYKDIIKGSSAYKNMSDANKDLVEKAFNSDEYLLPRKLRMRTEDNYTEVIAPKWWLEENNLEEGEYIYNDEKMRTAIAVRIPTTGIHSALPIRIIASPTKTNLIIAPEELVPLHGSDFDVDALFYIRRETASKKDGIKVFDTIESYLDYTKKLRDINTKYKGKDLIRKKKLAELNKEYVFNYGLIGYTKDGKWDTALEERVLSQIANLEANPSKETEKYLAYLYEMAIKLEKNKKIDAYLEIITAEKNQEDMNTPIEFTAIKADIFENVDSSTTAENIIEALTSSNIPDYVRVEVEKVLKDENGEWKDPSTWLDMEALKPTDRYPDGRLIIKDESILKGLLKTNLGVASKLKMITKNISLNENRDVYNIAHNYKYHEDNFQGVSGTGIQANLMKVVSYLQFASTMKGGTGKLLPIVKEGKDGEVKETPREYKFNGTVYDSFEVTTKRDGVRTTELGDSVLNGYIDNVKELITFIINANGHTISMIGTMISLGIDLDTITYFMQQPIVRYISSNPSGIQGKIRSSKKFLKGKIPQNELTKDEDLDISDEALIENIRFDTDVSTIFKKEQLLDADLKAALLEVRKRAIEHAKGKLNTWQSRRAIEAGKELKERGDFSISDVINPDQMHLLELEFPGAVDALMELESKINTYVNDKEAHFKTLLKEAKDDDGTIDSEFKKAKQKAVEQLFTEGVDPEGLYSQEELALNFFATGMLKDIISKQEAQKEQLFKENKAFYKSQLEVLQMFEKINALSSEIEGNTKFLRILKDLPVSYDEMVKVSEADTSKDLVAPLTDIPNIQAATQRLGFLTELVEKTFKLYDPLYTSYFNKIVNDSNYNTEGSLHSSYEKVEMVREEFQQYLMTGVMELVPTEGYIGFDVKGGLTKDPTKVSRFTSERELRIQILMDKINKISSKIKGNKFSDLLKPKLNRKGNYRLEFLAGTNLDPTQELELTNAYLELPVELKQLLIQYAAIVEGAKFGFKSYSKFIPPTESEPGANDGLDFISQRFEEILSMIDKGTIDNFEKQFVYLNRDKVRSPKGLRPDGDMLVFTEEAKIPDSLPTYINRSKNVYKLVSIPGQRPYYVADGVVDANNYVFNGTASSPKRVTLDNDSIVRLINETSGNYKNLVYIPNVEDGDYAVFSSKNQVDTGYIVSIKDNSVTAIKATYRQSVTSKSRPISELKLKKTLDVLKKNTGLDYSIDPIEFKRVLAKAGHTGDYPAGFVYKGKVYINTTGEGNMYGADTALHEYAHLYIDHIKKTNPALYNRILTLAAKNKFYNSVKEQYPNLKGNDLLEEVAVTFIGTQGKSNKTIIDAIKRILRSLGIEAFTTLEDLANDLLTKNLELENIELESVMLDINKLREQMVSNGQIKIEYNELCK